MREILKNIGYDVPELHAHEQYGYHEESTITLKNWYKDYMRCTILDKNTNKYVGINPEVYLLKPPHKNNFDYTIEMDFNEEPRNFLEEIKTLFHVVNTTLGKGNTE